MHYQYISICRGGRSILEKLREAGIEPSDYIRFYSLRSHDIIKRSKIEELLAQQAGFTPSSTVEDEVEFARVSDAEEYDGDLKNSDFVTEELYIHAKLLIADGMSRKRAYAVQYLIRNAWARPSRDYGFCQLE